MDENEKDLEVTPEEAEAEKEATKEVNEDEIREKLADELGIDPDDDSELLDKLVTREKANRERLSGAIKQKINWRDKAKKYTSGKPEENPKGGNTPKQETPEDPYEIARKVLREEMDNQALESLNLPDELKNEIKDLAKVKGISIREASQLPYIQSRKEEIEREARITSASPKRSKKGSGAPSYDPSKPLDINDFKTADGNIDTEAWQEAKVARRRFEASNK